MSFLFELQRKKTNTISPDKKKISMDVRVPARSFHNSAANSRTPQKEAGKFHFSYSPYSEVSTKRIDGVKTSFHIDQAKLEYAQRVSEMSYPRPAKKPIADRAETFIFFRRFLQALYERVQNIHIFIPGITPNKLVYGSIMSGVAFGMVSLGVIERTLESNATASEGIETRRVENVTLETANYRPEKDVFMQYFSDAADAEYQASVRELVKGHPIEEMLPYIFEKDRITAAFLIGIAKKESNWGKRRPVLEGQDCFNYWGYRGQRRLMGSGGHTCFNSRKDAVDSVAKRLETLINSERLNTPAKLIVWKCGMSCEGHSRESVEKWIADVDAYYGEMMALEAENTELEEPLEGS